MKAEFFSSLPAEAIKIRTEVFVQEQGFHNEFDTIDDIAKHLVVFIEGTPVATGRMYWGKKEGTCIIGRIAVIKKYRKKGLGRWIIQELEEEAKKQNCRTLELSAQLRVSEFYEKLGYQKVGKIYMDEHCRHIRMMKKFSSKC